MPSIYEIKPKFQNLLRPFVRFLFQCGVTANQVTLGSSVLSIAYGLLLTFFPANKQILICLPIILFVRMAFNAIDGMLAREFKMSSNLGAVLNELTDVISDVALYLPFAGVGGFSPTLIVLIVILAVVSEMAGVISIPMGAERRYDGPMGKSDRAAFFGVTAALLGFGVPTGPWISYVLWAILLLLHWTIINRTWRGLIQARVK